MSETDRYKWHFYPAEQVAFNGFTKHINPRFELVEGGAKVIVEKGFDIKVVSHHMGNTFDEKIRTYSKYFLLYSILADLFYQNN